MTLSPWKLPVDVVSRSFQEMVEVVLKPENAAQPVVGPFFPLICMEDHDALWRALLTEFRQRGALALDCFDLRQLEAYSTLFIEMSLTNVGKTEYAIILRARSMAIEVCERKVPSGFRAHSSISKSKASVLPDMTTKSAKKLMVEPPAIVS